MQTVFVNRIGVNFVYAFIGFDGKNFYAFNVHGKICNVKRDDSTYGNFRGDWFEI